MRWSKVFELEHLPERLHRRAVWHFNQARTVLVDWLIPIGVQRASRSFRLSLEAWSSPAELQTISQLRERHAGERCFILGAGPSIAKQDLRPLRNEVCIATSSFFVHQHYELIGPQYHCVPNFCSPPHPEAAAVSWFEQMHNALGSATLITDLGNRRVIEKHALFKGRTVHYIKTGGSWSMPLPRVLDLRRRMPPVQSVPVMALMAALYMGFEKIYLMGCDHSWLDHIGESRHFYPENKVAWTAWQAEPWGPYSVELDAMAELWAEYRQLRRYAERRGQHIYNATHGGRLDVFERVDYESLFSNSAPPVGMPVGSDA